MTGYCLPVYPQGFGNRFCGDMSLTDAHISSVISPSCTHIVYNSRLILFVVLAFPVFWGEMYINELIMPQVKLANQEVELVGLLEKLPLGTAEFAVVRERAQLLCQGKLDRGKAVLPLKLAAFLFHVLVQSHDSSEGNKELGFNAALSALSMYSLLHLISTCSYLGGKFNVDTVPYSRTILYLTIPYHIPYLTIDQIYIILYI